MDLRKLDGFARMHLGLITRASAAAVGVNRSAWYRAIRRGELQPVQPNVARIYGQPSSRQQAILAAVLALAPAGDNPAVVLASHRSAAFLLGLQRPATDPIDITVDSLHARELDGVIEQLVRRTSGRPIVTGFPVPTRSEHWSTSERSTRTPYRRHWNTSPLPAG